MKLFDLHNNCEVAVGLNNQTISTNTTTNGAIIDTAGFHGVEWFVQSGTVTDGAYVAQVWESDDSGMAGAVQVTGDALLGSASFADTDDNAAKRIGSLGKLRYQQLRIVSTGTSSGGVFSAVAAKFSPLHAPVANQ